MKLFGEGWVKLLAPFFDHKITLYEAVEEQDSTGDPTEVRLVEAEGLTNLVCAAGNLTLAKTSTNTSMYGAEESRYRILIEGAHPDIKVGLIAILDGDNDVKYMVGERTPSQSEDVTEIVVSRWH